MGFCNERLFQTLRGHWIAINERNELLAAGHSFRELDYYVKIYLKTEKVRIVCSKDKGIWFKGEIWDEKKN